MTSLVGGPSMVGGLGPRPPAPPLNPALAFSQVRRLKFRAFSTWPPPSLQLTSGERQARRKGEGRGKFLRSKVGGMFQSECNRAPRECFPGPRCGSRRACGRHSYRQTGSLHSLWTLWLST